MHNEKTMIDDQVPTNQFHPYIRPEIPEVQRDSALIKTLRRVGLSDERVEPLKAAVSRVTSRANLVQMGSYVRRNAWVLATVAIAGVGAFLLTRKLRT